MGAGFNEATLEVKYKGKSIADLLDLTIAEAVVHFREHPKIFNKLQLLVDVGLDYLQLGPTVFNPSLAVRHSVSSWPESSPKLPPVNLLYPR